MLFDLGFFGDLKSKKSAFPPLPVAHRHGCIPIFDYVIRWTHPSQYNVFRSNMRILGVRRESREYDENPESTMGIPGVRWKSWEYNENPGSTMGIPGVQRESMEYNGNPKNPGSTQSAFSPLVLVLMN
jgi:hypothetical protein